MENKERLCLYYATPQHPLDEKKEKADEEKRENSLIKNANLIYNTKFSSVQDKRIQLIWILRVWSPYTHPETEKGFAWNGNRPLVWYGWFMIWGT